MYIQAILSTVQTKLRGKLKLSLNFQESVVQGCSGKGLHVFPWKAAGQKGATQDEGGGLLFVWSLEVQANVCVTVNQQSSQESNPGSQTTQKTVIGPLGLGNGAGLLVG